MGGSTNSRIVRTTAKHAHHNTVPSLYVVGMTFVNRWEAPVNKHGTELEGAWCNPRAYQIKEDDYLGFWTRERSEQWDHLNMMAHTHGEVDQYEQVLYQVLMLQSWLRQQGHRLLVYRQIDDFKNVEQVLQHERLQHFDNPRLFVNNYAWASIAWQAQQGVPENTGYEVAPPPEFRHRRPGHHHQLNKFLADYVQQHTVMS